MSRIIITIAMAASIGGAVVPCTGMAQPETGNRANGYDYQPTPGEVLPLERRDGVAATPEQGASHGRTLEKIDRELLRNNGLSTSSVPNMTGHQEQATPPTTAPR
jgi:hypothetical protein